MIFEIYYYMNKKIYGTTQTKQVKTLAKEEAQNILHVSLEMHVVDFLQSRHSAIQTTIY